MGPPADDVDWTDQTDSVIDGCGRFLDRVWRLAVAADGARPEDGGGPLAPGDLEVRRATHRLIARVSRDYERWSYNTAVAALREHTNVLYRYVQSPAGARRDVLEQSVDTLLLLLAPMAPHVTAELWERRKGAGERLHSRPWPEADPSMLAEDLVTLVVQVNGKLKDRIEVAASATEEEVVAVALASLKVAAALGGRSPARVIARPPQLVNIVV